MRDNEFMSIKVPLSQHDRRLLEDGLGRAGHAVCIESVAFTAACFSCRKK